MSRETERVVDGRYVYDVMCEKNCGKKVAEIAFDNQLPVGQDALAFGGLICSGCVVPVSVEE
jgi:hypothetical protein